MGMPDICAFREGWACLPRYQARMSSCYCVHSATPATRGLRDRRPSHCWMEQAEVSTAPSLSLGKGSARRSRLMANVAFRGHPMSLGTRTGVLVTYAWYSGSCPQRCCALSYSRRTPLTLISRKVTNSGEIMVTSCQPLRAGRATSATPNHRRISPK